MTETSLPWSGPFDERTTEADILACFRLLLGRHPNPEEWPGHSANAGAPLSAVVSSFVDSLEFARRRLGVAAPAGARLQATRFEGFRIMADPEDLAVGRAVIGGSYEPEVVAVFRDVLRPGMAAIDVGANIGVFTMLAASLVGPEGSVLAFEPNPRNARMAEASRRLNGFAHVTILQAAAGRAPGMLAINTAFSNGTTSSIEDDVLGVQSVAAVPVDGIVPPGRRIDLIKIDVEGAEYNVLLGAAQVIRRDRPVIVFEFGPGQLPGISGVTGGELLQWLVAIGYGFEVIDPSGPLKPVGTDWQAVMAAYERRGNDHIDVVARPLGGKPAPQPPGLLARMLGRKPA